MIQKQGDKVSGLEETHRVCILPVPGSDPDCASCSYTLEQTS